MPELPPKPIAATTRYCAVYGHPIKHSASPAMQNAGIAAMGLDWRYLAFEVYPERLEFAIAGAKAMNFIGLNLTVPHKVLAVPMMDALDDSARLMGAVNTVRFEGRDGGGAWRPLREWNEPPPETRAQGFNTDADAISRVLHAELGLTLRGAKVVVLGTGGAGRTAAMKLASEKVAELFLVNRTPAKAEAVREEISKHWPEVITTIGYPTGRVDLVINSTSLGLKQADPLPFDQSRLSLQQTRAVYDMVYRPAETPFLRLAKAAGAQVANGLEMLLHQGAKALEIWTGETPPLQVMREALRKEVYGS